MSFQAGFEASAYLPDQIISSDLPEIVISGRSNVGKSSLINRLANRKSLARISSEPGKTVSINFYLCGSFRLVDLPGYGYARVSKEEKAKWAELVESYFNDERHIAFILQLLDSRHPPSKDDQSMIGYIKSRGIPFIAAATKCDKMNRKELLESQRRLPAEADIPPEKLIFCSSHTGEGIETLEKIILRSIPSNN